jgi:serine protease inhibitor
LKRIFCDRLKGLATDHSDYGYAASEPLRIADVIHQAFITVAEKGTEAG